MARGGGTVGTGVVVGVGVGGVVWFGVAIVSGLVPGSVAVCGMVPPVGVPLLAIFCLLSGAG